VFLLAGAGTACLVLAARIVTDDAISEAERAGTTARGGG
jgi:hypothetical protein